MSLLTQNPLIIDIVQFELAFASTDVEAIEALTVASGDSVQVPLSLEGPDDLRLMADEEVTVRVSLGGVELTLLPEIIFTAENLVTTFTLEIPDSAVSGTLNLTARAGLSGVEIASTTVPVTITEPPREFRLVFREQTDANVPSSIIDNLAVTAGGAAEVWLSLEGVDGAFLSDDESVTVSLSLLSDNAQFTATDNDGGVLDTVVLTSTENGLITLDATANV